MAQYDVDLRDYWRIIRKRKFSIILMVMLVAACSYGFAKFREPLPLYEAVAAIKIDRSTNMASLLTGEYWFQSESMATHAYIIRSFPVLAETAKSMGWIPGDPSFEEIRNNEDYLAAINRLRAMVEPEHQQGTNIINIRVVSEGAREVARIANAFAEAYREYNIREKNKKTFDTKKFIEEQLQLISKKLKQAEQELQNFREGYSLTSLDAQTQNILNNLYTIENDYEKTKWEKKEVLAQLQALKVGEKGIADASRRVSLSAGKDSPLYGLKTKLSDLFLKRQTLLINLTEKHPQIREIDDQIQAVILETKKELHLLLNTLESRGQDLLTKLRLLRKENQRMPEKGLLLIRLQREVDMQQSLYSQLKERYQETLIQESGKVEEVTFIRPALPPSEPFNIPSKLMVMITGIIMGVIIGLVFAFLSEVLDTSIGTIEDVEELLQVPVLGVIPFLGHEGRAKRFLERKSPQDDRMSDLITHYEPKSLAAEAFRALRTNLQFLRLEQKGKVFLITSSFIKEGKTLNVVNLALSMAQAGNKVLLVDADLRKPLVNKVFGLSREPGVSDYLLGNYDWKEIVNTISDVMLGEFKIDDVLKTPGLDSLHVFAAGTRPPNPTELLSSTRFKEFLRQASQVYNYILIDAPPILPVTDAAEIAPLVDGVFLVYTVGKIGRGILKRAKLTLDNVDAKVLGVILNNVKPEAGPDYFKYHSQHYYGSDAKIGQKSKISNMLQGINKPSLRGRLKYFRFAVLFIVLVLLLLGIFWQDILKFNIHKWLTFL